MREIVLDTETTGLSPKNGDRVVEIGCVELINFIPSGKTYHQYINPERNMPDEAFRVHGLSEEFLSDKPVFNDIAQDFLNFIGNNTLIIHNAAFDMEFLNHELVKTERAPLKSERVKDTLALARQKLPGARASLDALCAHFHIDNSNRTLHGALLDSEILAEVYLELIGGRQASLDLASKAAAERKAVIDANPTQKARQRPKPLISRLTPESQKDHAAFISSLGDEAIWKKYTS